jgi:hypothetical protein
MGASFAPIRNRTHALKKQPLHLGLAIDIHYEFIFVVKGILPLSAHCEDSKGQ